MSRAYRPADCGMMTSRACATVAVAFSTASRFFHVFEDSVTVVSATVFPCGSTRRTTAFPPPLPSGVRVKSEKSYFSPSFTAMPSNPVFVKPPPGCATLSTA